MKLFRYIPILSTGNSWAEKKTDNWINKTLWLSRVVDKSIRLLFSGTLLLLGARNCTTVATNRDDPDVVDLITTSNVMDSSNYKFCSISHTMFPVGAVKYLIIINSKTITQI